MDKLLIPSYLKCIILVPLESTINDSIVERPDTCPEQHQLKGSGSTVVGGALPMMGNVWQRELPAQLVLCNIAMEAVAHL